jgi:hypothetical protein
MRDPARIPIILERLRKVWEAHPDLRLGQLVVNGATVRPHSDPFYIEDEALITRLEALAKPTRPDLAPVPSEPVERVAVFKENGKFFQRNSDGSVEPFSQIPGEWVIVGERVGELADKRPFCADDAHVWQSRALGEYVWCMNCPARKDGR